MELIQQCYHDLFWGALVLLGLGLLAVMVYIIRARLTVDRIIGINLTGTLVAIIIAILAYLLGEDYLVDVAIVYVVLSFIAVMLAVGLRPVLWKLLLMVILQWCTSPLSGHMLAQFEYRVNQNLEQHLELPAGGQEDRA